MIDWSEPTLTPLIRENQKIYTEFLNTRFAEHLVKYVLEPLDQCYFRSEFVGFDPLPERNNPKRPLIFASNHSGMAFPWDAIVFSAQIFKRNNYDLTKAVRPMTAPMLSQSTLMNPFLVQNFWKRVGSVEATSLNFETMMFYEKSNLLVYPEGVPGIGKGFDKKYQLQRFATSFIRISLKYKTDIIPFATVNGEYINPYAYNSKALNKTVNKVGIPFLPVGFMTLLIPFQPWLFYFGFPAKLTYVMGKRIKPYEMLDKPLEKITEQEVADLTETVRKKMQAELNAAVSKYGVEPYAAKEFFAACRKNAKKYPYFLPFFWPSLFTECERRVSENDGSEWELTLLSGIKTFLKRPLNFAFFLPLIGWLPILWRGYKKW
jgi:1-acyl-sn-glycerol-3-phosphate acyltransferase